MQGWEAGKVERITVVRERGQELEVKGTGRFQIDLNVLTT